MIRFLLFVSWFILFTPNVYSQTNPCANHQCIAVVDAGSTGSRLHIFAYDMDETKTPAHINEIWAKKIKPGFATLDTSQATIEPYLGSLFAGAPGQQIPVYFYATAGMRLMPQAKQNLYYQHLRHWFSQNTNWQLRESKTITGEDEALYDWLSVNYHLGTLKSAPNDAVGVLDIGGASTQIAFPIHDGTNLDKNSQISLKLYNQRINLFVHSFLGLGQNEMSHQALDSVSCFTNNYPLPNGNVGQGNASECAMELSTLINGVHKVNNIVQPTLMSNPVHTWYALGGITYTAESKPFQFPSHQLTAQEFLQQANSLTCNPSWEELSNQFPNNEYVDAYCLLPAFYYALMVDGYGFSPNQTVNYMSASVDLDWTLGVVLHHPGYNSSNEKSSTCSSTICP